METSIDRRRGKAEAILRDMDMHDCFDTVTAWKFKLFFHQMKRGNPGPTGTASIGSGGVPMPPLWMYGC
jgi:hypothetical protein